MSRASTRGSRIRRLAAWLALTLAILLMAAGCAPVADTGGGQGTEITESLDAPAIMDEHGSYTSKEDVAQYLHLYGHLPDNYLTKAEAEALGWDSREGNLWEVAPGASIGGSRFGNYEEQLPVQKGRQYYECDVDYQGGYRNAKRIVYSSDGLIFYTEDHYETFEQLY
ncbi:MAG TPA: ribonuclease [Candidatus Ventrimonas merdavium]|nr:ribonuclease [Candidatus Ventrimonas merdavium]